ncbi:nucleic acid-binding protein [Patellaria atrata CBS 101060]|uniref:Nucleic acid-binding protein n=1 Tax=Patellaria atrata CBS 101060 TaxID=1346257 RepID=A0A9P4SFJ8_9PEZI|nr:nucleic acid-binding protein [Patellaria atrata CBS 101060]
MYAAASLRASRFALPSTRTFSTTPRASFAKMQIIGRLAAEPETQTTKNGREYVRYAVGTDDGPRVNRQTSWYKVTCFDEGPRRDFLLNLPKGTLIHVDTNATMATFEDESGKKHTRLNLLQRSIEVLSRPRRQEGEGESEVEEATLSE